MDTQTDIIAAIAIVLATAGAVVSLVAAITASAGLALSGAIAIAVAAFSFGLAVYLNGGY